MRNLKSGGLSYKLSPKNTIPLPGVAASEIGKIDTI